MVDPPVSDHVDQFAHITRIISSVRSINPLICRTFVLVKEEDVLPAS